MFEMGEHECSPRNLGDLAGADGDVLEGAPAPSESRGLHVRSGTSPSLGVS